jgi:hypothetical protein
MQRPHPLDDDRAVHLDVDEGTHLLQEQDEVDDLRLHRGV